MKKILFRDLKWVGIEPEIVEARKWCIKNNITFYPVIVSNQQGAKNPNVYIEKKEGFSTTRTLKEYPQNEKLYSDIYGLYLYTFNQKMQGKAA